MPQSRRPRSRSQGSQQPPIGGNSDRRIWSQAGKTRLDTQTNGGHTYLRQVFTPYLPQHQRITVLDRVNVGYRLSLSSFAKRRIRVGGRRRSTRSYFTGRIQVLLYPRRWTPIPSVAPDARILWYRTRPSIGLQFAKDRGQVVYVRSRSRRVRTVMLTFGTDADKGYFGGDIPKEIYAHTYPSYMKWRLQVHPRVAAKVKRHMAVVGLRPGMSLDKAMGKLVPYLRSFVARPLRDSERLGDAYLSLLKARVGVCRHRAMIFTVTMQTLGFPARFAANNAHAFAELQYPSGRWRQVDLGGGDIPHWMGDWKGKAYKPPKDPFPPPASVRVRAPQPSGQNPFSRQWGAPGSSSGVPGRGRVRSVVIRKRKRRKKRVNYVSHTRIR